MTREALPIASAETKPDDAPAAPKVSFAVYHYEGCPYCDLVRTATKELGVEVEWRDIEQEPQHRSQLVAARGRATVPVLRITREGAPDEWMPESGDIVRFFEKQNGTPSRGRSHDGWVRIASWALLFAGGMAPEPARTGLWTLACTVAAVRSTGMAIRTGAPRHWAIAGVFALGAVSILSSGLGIADLPWWWAAFGVAAVVLASALMRGRKRSEPRPRET